MIKSYTKYILTMCDIKNWTLLEKHGKLIDPKHTVPNKNHLKQHTCYIQHAWLYVLKETLRNSVTCHTRDVIYSKTIFTTAMLSTISNRRGHTYRVF